jgi:hypothetical protein
METFNGISGDLSMENSTQLAELKNLLHQLPRNVTGQDKWMNIHLKRPIFK